MGLASAFAKGFHAQRWVSQALHGLWRSIHHVTSSERDQPSTALHWEFSMQAPISISQLVGQGLFVQLFIACFFLLGLSIIDFLPGLVKWLHTPLHIELVTPHIAHPSKCVHTSIIAADMLHYNRQYNRPPPPPPPLACQAGSSSVLFIFTFLSVVLGIDPVK